MNIFRYFQYAIVVIVMSLGIFPFIPSFFPTANTKMLLAGVGFILLCIQRSKDQNNRISSNFFIASICAVMVSFAGVLTMMYNGTKDYTYATYLVSMWVWLGSAYLILNLINIVHKKQSFQLVANYLIVVCVVQCILALLMSHNPTVKSFIDSLLIEEGFMGKAENRMYGLGCSLDVAGTRFAAVLILISSLCVNIEKIKQGKFLPMYLLAFIIITIIGNMISRTTIIGTGLALVYWIVASGMWRMTIVKEELRLWKFLLMIFVITLPIVVYGYNNNHVFHENVRFAFEGFFSMIEKGYWETNSNNKLANMWVLPMELKTWIIGDGFFDNPLLTDPYYNGLGIGTYYMNTDIGYLRFIYYFGIIGLTMFCVFFIYLTKVCMKKFPENKVFFLFLLLLNMIVWCKVSSDIFPIYAFFLCLTAEGSSDKKKGMVTNLRTPLLS